MNGIKEEKQVGETSITINFGVPFKVPHVFTLTDDLTRTLWDGGDVTITFHHPRHGEKFIAKIQE